MTQVVVCNSEQLLKLLAQKSNMEEDVRPILRQSANTSSPTRPRQGLGLDIALRFAGEGLSQPLAELRGQSVHAMDIAQYLC